MKSFSQPTLEKLYKGEYDQLNKNYRSLIKKYKKSNVKLEEKGPLPKNPCCPISFDLFIRPVNDRELHSKEDANKHKQPHYLDYDTIKEDQSRGRKKCLVTQQNYKEGLSDKKALNKLKDAPLFDDILFNFVFSHRHNEAVKEQAKEYLTKKKKQIETLLNKINPSKAIVPIMLRPEEKREEISHYLRCIEKNAKSICPKQKILQSLTETSLSVLFEKKSGELIIQLGSYSQAKLKELKNNLKINSKYFSGAGLCISEPETSKKMWLFPYGGYRVSIRVKVDIKALKERNIPLDNWQELVRDVLLTKQLKFQEKTSRKAKPARSRSTPNLAVTWTAAFAMGLVMTFILYHALPVATLIGLGLSLPSYLVTLAEGSIALIGGVSAMWIAKGPLEKLFNFCFGRGNSVSDSSESCELDSTNFEKGPSATIENYFRRGAQYVPLLNRFCDGPAEHSEPSNFTPLPRNKFK